MSTTTVDDLVEYELVAVQQALLKPVAPYHDSSAVRVSTVAQCRCIYPRGYWAVTDGDKGDKGR